jgi:sugar phosphate isomerase/epimerase
MLNLARRISFNHATFGPDVSFRAFLETVSESGAAGIGVWTDRLDGLSAVEAGKAIRDVGLQISGVNRGGFFTGATGPERQSAVDQTLRQIEATIDLGGDMLVIVPGGLAKDLRRIELARDHVRWGLEKIEGFAKASGVRLAIEPFHPALSAARGVVNTLDLAVDIALEFGDHVGVVTDIFHIWWDPNVYAAIARGGSRIFGHHLCDWKLETIDPFADRGVMGEGVADVPGLTAAVMDAGYQGLMEIEIFSRNDLWTMDRGAISALCLQRALCCLKTAGEISKDKRLQNV